MNPPHELKFCRLCLCSNGRLLDIFMESNPCKSDVAKAIQDLLQLKVVKEDCLRWLICHSCVARLHEFRDFKCRCLRSKLVCDSVFQVQVKRSKEGGFIQSGGGFPGDPLDAGNTDGLLQGIDSSSTGSDMTPIFEDAGKDEVESILEYCWCSECGKEFSSLRELKGHSQGCRAEGKPVWDSVVADCEQEGTVDFSETAKQQPLDPNVCCARCRKVFRTTERLVRHINKYNFKCKAKASDRVVNAAVESPKVVGWREMCSLSIDSDAIYEQQNNDHTSTLKKRKGKENNNSQNISSALFQKKLPTHEQCKCTAAMHDSKCRKLSQVNESSSGNTRHIDKVSSTTELNSISHGQHSFQSANLNLKETDASINSVCTGWGENFKSGKIPTQHTCMNKCCSDVKMAGSKDLDEGDRVKIYNNRGILSNVQECNLISRLEPPRILDESKIDSILGCGLNDKPSRVCDISNDEVIISKPEWDMLLICDYCNKQYTTKSELRNHIVKCHLSLDPQKCPVCHRLFMNREELEEHSIKHPGDKKFYCTVCEESLSFRSGLKKHITERHHVKSAFICSICFNGFASRANLGVHHTLVHNESDKRFKCSNCGRSYMDENVYKNHIKLCQLNSISFPCDVCGKQLTSKSNLDTHHLIHLKLRKFPCPLCPKIFTQCGARNTHLRSHHLNIRPFECGICNKRFSLKSRLQQHYSSHSDERPFKCPECPKSFKLKGTRLNHLRVVHLKV